jgi:hypothetical protein
MADNLTRQVRSISDVTKAFAAGDLTQQVDVDAQGEMLELKETVNTMVDQIGAFSSEVTRVAMEVGTRGILGSQAKVPGVQGTWESLTNNVNVGILTHFTKIGQLIVVLADNGRQPDSPSPIHLRCDQSSRSRRPDAESERRCSGRDAGAEGNCQHDGGSTRCFLERGFSCCGGGGYTRNSRRAGAGARCAGNMVGAD